MAQTKVFNTRKVGGPIIILQIPKAGDAIVPAEGDGEGGLIEGAEGVIVFADKAWLQARYGKVRGLMIE